MTSIIATGDHPPSIRVLKACKVADETFTQKIELDVTDLPPPPRGYRYCLDTAITLKIAGPVAQRRSQGGDVRQTERRSDRKNME